MTTHLSDEWMQRLGPAVLPFERNQFNRAIEEGEDIIFADDILRVVNRNSLTPVTLPVSIVVQDHPMQGKYLWIIDEQGLKIMPESTPNPYADRKIVCHTNITGGAPALQGGELWFGDDGKVYLNYKSGRYGAKIGSLGTVHRIAVLDFFRSLDFDPVILDTNFR